MDCQMQWIHWVAGGGLALAVMLAAIGITMVVER